MSNPKANVVLQKASQRHLQSQPQRFAKQSYPPPQATSQAHLQKYQVQNFSTPHNFNPVPAVKDITSIEVTAKPNTTYLHMFYILLVVASNFMIFSYFSSQQKPPTIIYEKITEKSIETRPAIVVTTPAPVQHEEQSFRSTASVPYVAVGHNFERDSIVQQVRAEFSDKRSAAFNDHIKEVNNYRDSHKKYYENKEYQEITNRYEKKKSQIYGEEYAELCKKTSESYYCVSAENYEKIKDKFN